jgi:hypothetical protein
VDGRLDLVASRDRAWIVVDPAASDPPPRYASAGPDVASFAVAVLYAGAGPSIVGVSGEGPVVWRPAGGRHAFLALSLSGRDGQSDQIRSNVSGIGVHGAVRTESRWTAFDTWRSQSGPGQSLQPVAIGRHADLVAAPPGATDPRFIGRTEDHALTVEFDQPLEDGNGAPLLVLDGWIEYPYAQTVFAAWQAGAAYRAPTLEARDEAGRWTEVLREFGYPAGMPRQMTVPLARLPRGTWALRLSSSQEIYWDRIAVAYSMAGAGVRHVRLAATSARLNVSGFAARSTGPQRAPRYDYQRRLPLWDARHQRGWYTAVGPVEPLVAEEDGAVAIFGPGEEVHLEFAAPPPPPPGWTRRIVLEVRGWCKDMDLYTRDGETVEPVPDVPSSDRERLHRLFNTRYAGGR